MNKEIPMLKSVPCCYFPTETVLVDDKLAFLNTLKLELGENIQTLAFTNPKEGLVYLKQKSPLADAFINQYVEESVDYSGQSLKKGRLITLSSLYKEVYNPARFKLTSVIVVDFAMPQMNGRDFALALKGTAYKILMLTGEADNDIAVELFNKGVIHKFILKGQENYLGEVAAGVEELKMKYFLSLSENLLSSLGSTLEAILSDSAYIQKYVEICKEYSIVESYLLDDSGSQLLLDASGNAFWFFVKTEEDMQMLYDFALDVKSTPASVIQSIKNKEKLTHFFNTKDSYSPVNWILYDSHPIKGENTYYYALTQAKEKMPLDTKKLISYNQYLLNSE